MQLVRAMALTAGIFSLLASSSAVALSILPTSTTRSVQASSGSVTAADSSTQRFGEWGGAENANDPTNSMAGTASASQTSRVPFSIFGEEWFVISLDATTTDALTSAQSEFEVIFQVDEVVQFSIQSEYTTCFSVLNCSAAVSLTGAGVAFSHNTGCCPSGLSSKQDTGVLMPNVDYRLSASVSGSCAPFDPCGFGSADILLVVPEPGTGTLVLTALVGLGGYRRGSIHRGRQEPPRIPSHRSR